MPTCPAYESRVGAIRLHELPTPLMTVEAGLLRAKIIANSADTPSAAYANQIGTNGTKNRSSAAIGTYQAKRGNIANVQMQIICDAGRTEMLMPVIAKSAAIAPVTARTKLVSPRPVPAVR